MLPICQPFIELAPIYSSHKFLSMTISTYHMFIIFIWRRRGGEREERIGALTSSSHTLWTFVFFCTEERETRKAGGRNKRKAGEVNAEFWRLGLCRLCWDLCCTTPSVPFWSQHQIMTPFMSISGCLVDIVVDIVYPHGWLSMLE